MRTEGPSLPATPSITQNVSRGVPACRHPLHRSKRERRGPSACRHPLRCLKCERRALSACHPLHRSKCDCHHPLQPLKHHPHRSKTTRTPGRIRKRGISFCYFFLLFLPFSSLFRDVFCNLLQSFTNFGKLL